MVWWWWVACVLVMQRERSRVGDGEWVMCVFRCCKRAAFFLGKGPL